MIHFQDRSREFCFNTETTVHKSPIWYGFHTGARAICHCRHYSTFKYNTFTKRVCHYNSELSKLPDGFHNALFTNLLAAPLSILRDAMTKQIEKNNNNNSSLSLINPQTATYKLPLPVNKTIHLNFVNQKQQVLTIFLASFWESVLIWFLNHCCAQELLHSTRMKENVQMWPIIAWYQSSQWLGKKLTRTWIGMMIFRWFLKRLLQASVQLSRSETLSLVTILLCCCTCTASLELLQCSLGKL